MPDGRVALGDDVAWAACYAAEDYLESTQGPSQWAAAPDAIREAAVEKGMKAGVRAARSAGKRPTDSQVVELRRALEEAVIAAMKVQLEESVGRHP